MTIKYNPFRPNSPVYTGMFAGRMKEINRIDELLYQAKFANPTNILIIGERGIGKSSLLLVANHFSKGTLTWAENKHNFLTVQISLGGDTTIIDLARKLNNGIIREFEKSAPVLTFIKKVGNFCKNGRWLESSIDRKIVP